jgi:hypothetical protein
MEEEESKVDGAGSELYKMEDNDCSCFQHFGLAAREMDGWLLNEVFTQLHLCYYILIAIKVRRLTLV